MFKCSIGKLGIASLTFDWRIKLSSHSLIVLSYKTHTHKNRHNIDFPRDRKVCLPNLLVLQSNTCTNGLRTHKGTRHFQVHAPVKFAQCDRFHPIFFVSIVRFKSKTMNAAKTPTNVRIYGRLIQSVHGMQYNIHTNETQIPTHILGCLYASSVLAPWKHQPTGILMTHRNRLANTLTDNINIVRVHTKNP